MPFTTSHPAVVLLLKNLFPKQMSLTGLIAGAMAPDLLYFLEMNTVNRGMSHSWMGMFTICLPLGLLFSFAFHYLFKKELIEHLPTPLLKHFSGLAYSKWQIKSFSKFFILIISVLIGTLSHFAWDSCTHLHGEVVQSFPILQENLVLFGGHIRFFHLLQHLSTIVGGVAVIIYFAYQSNLPKRVAIQNHIPRIQKLSFWVIIPVLSGIFAYLVLHLYMYFAPERIASERAVFGLAGWAGFFYLVIALDIFKKLQRKFKKSTS